MNCRPITCFMSQLSYSGSAIEQSKLRKSLNHSLRTVNEQSQTMAWDEDLRHLNQLFHDGKWHQLDSLSEAQKYHLIESLLVSKKKPTQGITKSRQKRRSYEQKLRKYLSSNSQRVHSPDYQYIEKLLAIPRQTTIDLDQWLNEASNINFKRKQQRITCIEKFINIHNQLTALPNNLNSNMIEECIFVIPHRNKVTNVSGIDMAKALIKYYQTFFADYEIKAVAVHCDERSKNEKTGEHVHLFLDAQNKKTGEFDLRVHKANLAQQFLLKLDPSHPFKWFTNKGTNFNHDEQRLHGHALQDRFRYSVNQWLLNEKGLSMEFNQYTDKELPKKMRRDGKLAKDNREFNFQKRQQELELEKLNQQVTEAYAQRIEQKRKQAELDAIYQQEAERLQIAKSQRQAEEIKLQRLQEESERALQALNITKDKLIEAMQKLSERESLIAALDKIIEDLTQTITEKIQPLLIHLEKAIQYAVKSFVLNQRDESNLKKKMDKNYARHMEYLENQPFLYNILSQFKQALLTAEDEHVNQLPKPKNPNDSRDID